MGLFVVSLYLGSAPRRGKAFPACCDLEVYYSLIRNGTSHSRQKLLAFKNEGYSLIYRTRDSGMSAGQCLGFVDGGLAEQ